ncbi:putative bifunctional enzyme with isomerase/decarboxylase activity [Includes:5-carboxymethyl-2-hydroxymuconate delta-isomerase/ 5-oxopent-3-ene-1,2,5-tricarboxylate decarboxylase] [Bradyrhizobium sp. ORS 285]|uniref:fumarylacetoacetate hydrolase family protein n=1 Tax=Bradyrhizobium sp. ORS 285 TaxID=115808 RepID=UPI0002407DFD|nr:fumarylacetoacetate hydrolase family protein [Bradyrhizobium sp. ORS 285]CCD84457.1 putative bifunctional enzyme with isomerase/decarboxylase activity (Includes:5-carboxymethyl-2-hydroxymuconate delta-isomerase/ 5-oxopent-3-ene-1,2,5-tricarboxylate decarboxylase) [Bradyrhizobium sp. ORS 285]SMX57256.1 putative bifunctional enzyme with isomerase/decarboxylase activity [Includes:5-carboxymethyl-2-hydroxymuconate delta-isomerase/ 5-oxopent-3-ene-1,2,5-tricarboxylate decarboxylase] [Bradyrhizobium
MKFASFKINNVTSWGLVEGDEIADLGAILRDRFPDLKSAIAADALKQAAAAASGAQRHALSAITFLPVIPNPDKILCIGLNYETHRKETGRSEVENPTVFGRFANSQTGHLSNIIRPRVSTDLDFEGELAIVIGKPGRYIPRSEAFQHIAGYACYNEGSVRDFQRHTHQFTPGKNFPDTGAFGPWLVTSDEIDDLGPLKLQTRLNGEVVQEATISQMIFDIPRQIEYCSSFTRLEPGDVIATGTPGGVGSRRTPPLWMKPGDVVEVEIDKIGLLRNGIADEAV